jgi:ABC-type lipoprotein export system ATPase subunit
MSNDTIHEKILSIRDVYRTYNICKTKIDVLRGVNLEVQKGEWLALLGISGSGKTTLLNLVGCLEKPDKGSIEYDNILLTKLSRPARTNLRKTKFGFIFQAYHLLPELTVLENVKLAAMLNGKNVRTAAAAAKKLLVQVGLQHRLKHKPGELSGGEQQRAAIARALVNEPELILADEPTGNLDSKTGLGILEILKELHANYSKTIIMVTHNREIADFADRTVVIKDGIIQKFENSASKRQKNVV